MTRAVTSVHGTTKIRHSGAKNGAHLRPRRRDDVLSDLPYPRNRTAINRTSYNTTPARLPKHDAH